MSASLKDVLERLERIEAILERMEEFNQLAPPVVYPTDPPFHIPSSQFPPHHSTITFWGGNPEDTA